MLKWVHNLFKKPKRGDVQKALELEALYKRAKIDQQVSGNTALSMDDEFRISVKSAFNHVYGDCISIWVSDEDHKGQWRVAHFSPARARLMAHWLIRQAEQAEALEGVKSIDKDQAEQCHRLRKQQ